MCGFLAYKGENVNLASFDAALATIAHRGPDSTQILNSVSYTLGLNRLAIQDLSEKSMQPMFYIYKNSIVYNGEVYNFKELRKELENLNYRFNTTVLVSKTKEEVQKQVWNFIALEFLIDQFINGNSYLKQEENIRQLLHKEFYKMF
jgi:asparagine synthetase B (glutamine-hydrolysing)